MPEHATPTVGITTRNRRLSLQRQFVYMPDTLVAHVPDPAGRRTTRYLRDVVRNDCLYRVVARI